MTNELLTSPFSIKKCLLHSEDVVEVGTGVRGEGAGEGGGSQRGHLHAGEAHGSLPISQSVSAQGEGDTGLAKGAEVTQPIDVRLPTIVADDHRQRGRSAVHRIPLSPKLYPFPSHSAWFILPFPKATQKEVL